MPVWVARYMSSRVDFKEEKQHSPLLPYMLGHPTPSHERAKSRVTAGGQGGRGRIGTGPKSHRSGGSGHATPFQYWCGNHCPEGGLSLDLGSTHTHTHTHTHTII